MENPCIVRVIHAYFGPRPRLGRNPEPARFDHAYFGPPRHAYFDPQPIDSIRFKNPIGCHRCPVDKLTLAHPSSSASIIKGVFFFRVHPMFWTAIARRNPVRYTIAMRGSWPNHNILPPRLLPPCDEMERT